MGNNISFKEYKGSISSHKAELLVCGLFEGEKFDKILDELNSICNLPKAVKTESFKRNYKKMRKKIQLLPSRAIY